MNFINIICIVMYIILTAGNIVHATDVTEGTQGLECIRGYIQQIRSDWNPEIKENDGVSYVGINRNEWDDESSKFIPVVFSNLDEVVDYVLSENSSLQNPLDIDSCWYGNSFSNKNEMAINYLLDSLTPIMGREEAICVADLGSGLGLSALLFMKKVVDFCRENHTQPRQPIELHLLDLVSENVRALDLIKSLVNSYYSQYFKVVTRVHDVVSDELPCDKFDFACAFNVWHFVRQSWWNMGLTAVGKGIKPTGLLLVTTDRGNPGVPDFTIGRIRVADKEFPADISCIDNSSSLNYLKDDEEPIPGAYYPGHKIKLELINKRFICKRAYSAEEAHAAIESGQLVASLGNYVFDEESLRNAVERHSGRLFEALSVEKQIASMQRGTVTLAFSKVIVDGAQA